MRFARSLRWAWLFLLWAGGLVVHTRAQMEEVMLEFQVGKNPVLVQLTHWKGGDRMAVAVLSTSPFWETRGFVPGREEYLGVVDRPMDAEDWVMLRALDWAKLEAAALATAVPAFREPMFKVRWRRGQLRGEFRFPRRDLQHEGSYSGELQAMALARYARYITEETSKGPAKAQDK